MNDPKQAVAFITTCLNFDSKIQVIAESSSSSSHNFHIMTSCWCCQVVEEVQGPPVMTVGKAE
jgi:hypothetical protein